MKTQTRPKTEYRVLETPSQQGFLGFASRMQSGAFALSCVTLLVAPFLFSGFWPVDRQFGTQSFFSVLAACAALLLALSPRNGSQISIKNWPLAAKYLVGFFAWCALSCIGSVYWHDTILEIARIGTAFAWFLILRELLRFRAPQTEHRLLDSRALALMIAAVLGLSIVGVLALNNFAQTHNPRQFGTFFNPNLMATACAMTLPLALAATFGAWRQSRNTRPQLTVFAVSLGVLLSLIVAGALVVTSSKGGFLAATVALVVFVVGLWRAQNANLRAVFRANRVLVVVALTFVLVGGGALATKTVLPRLLSARGTDDNSTMFRVYTWKSTLQMAQARPLFGWAPGGFAVAHDRFATVGTTKSAHQSWLQIASENGFPALILLASATIAFLVRGWKGLNSSRWPQTLGAMSAVVAFAVHGLTDAGWSVSSVVFLLMLCFALIESADGKSADIEYSKSESTVENGSRLRWSWLVLVLLMGAFSYAAQRAANGEDVRVASREAQRKGDLPLASQLAQDATETDPLSSRAWIRWGMMKAVESEGVEKAFARAAELNPQNNTTWRSWAEARSEMTASSTRTPATKALWDNAVACAPRDSSLLLDRAKWRLTQNANDAQAWRDLNFVVRERDAPYGRYAAVGDYVNLDFARATVLLAPHLAKNGDRTRSKSSLENALADVKLAQSKVAQQEEVAKANLDSEANFGPPRDLDELQSALQQLQKELR